MGMGVSWASLPLMATTEVASVPSWNTRTTLAHTGEGTPWPINRESDVMRTKLSRRDHHILSSARGRQLLEEHGGSANKINDTLVICAQ